VHECRVWWAAPVDPADAPHLVALLDEHERARLVRFRRADDRARYLAAHALARRAVAAVGDTDPAALVIDRTCRCGEPHGKPSVPGGPEFSLTHAGDLVGVAVHARPVGLDVERARPMSDLAGVAAHARSPAEPLPDAAGFFRLWTRKEALLKATGRGLAGPMSDITLDGARVASWTGEGAPDGPVWLVDLSPAPGHPGAVAGMGASAPDVVEEDGTALLRP
jgi:4'-phosphopantetheinyl transferase